MKTKAMKILAATGVVTSVGSSILPAYADEVSKNTPTNLKEEQGNRSSDLEKALKDANTLDGNMPIHVDTSVLDKAIEHAKQVGVTVNASEIISDSVATSLDEGKAKEAFIQKDYAEQANKIDAVATDYANLMKAYQTETDNVTKNNEEAKATYDKAKAIYDEAKATYDKEKAIYDKAKTIYDKDKLAYDEAKVAYDKAKSDYDKAKAKYDNDKPIYDNDKASYDVAKATYDAAKATYDREKVAYDKAKADYDVAKAKYDNDKVAYDKAKAEYDKAKAKYDNDKVAYDKAKAKYDQDKAKYDADKVAYDKAKAEYDKAKVAYAESKKNYDTSKITYDDYLKAKAAYDVAKAKYDKELATYQTELTRVQSENAKKQANYEKAKKAYDEQVAAISAENANAQKAYDDAMVRYQADVARIEKENAAVNKDYDRLMAEYNKKKAEAEANKNRPGYLSTPTGQALIFKREPNARVAITGNTRFVTDAGGYAASPDFKEQGIGGTLLKNSDILATGLSRNQRDAHTTPGRGAKIGYAMLFKVGDVITLRYTNLQSTVFAGKKVASIEYKLTVMDSPQRSGYINAMIYNDPTIFLDLSTMNDNPARDIRMKVEPKFYDSSGKQIDLSESDALFSFASLNYDYYKRQIESVQKLKGGKFLEITGSSVKAKGTELSANSNNSWTNSINANGTARYDAEEWDVTGSDLEYYGAGAMYVTAKDFSFELVNHTYNVGADDNPFKGYWQKFNTDVKANSVLPPKPVKKGETKPLPEKPTLTKKALPTAPVKEKDLPEPTKPVEPVKPNEPNKPVEPTLPIEPTKPVEPIAPTEPTKPVEPNAPTEPTKPVEPNAPTEPTKPTEPNKPVEPIAPTEPTKPVEPTEPTAPIEPEYKPLPIKPETPTVTYRYHALQIAPNVQKEVTNTSAKNIDNQFVVKGSDVMFRLTTEPLPAGRSETTSLVFEDALPSGYVLDLEKTKANNTDYTVEFNSQSKVIRYIAKADTLAKLNADLSKDAPIIAPIVLGSVVNDGATYENTFTISINVFDKDGKVIEGGNNNPNGNPNGNDPNGNHPNGNGGYVRHSNIVKVHTPGKDNDPNNPNNSVIRPEKVNKNKDGIVINGKAVLPGETNFYELNWDLNQYKDVKSTDEDIAKGFGYVDDYPEDVLELDSKNVRIVDRDGNTIDMIEVLQFDSVDKAPKEIQEMLAKANIQPNGAFQYFLVKDYQAFFNEYVKTGKSLTIASPMKVKSDITKETTYENKAYQIDFGNGYATEIVKNNVPHLESKKDVIIDINAGESVNNKEIALSQAFYYKLSGVMLPANRADGLSEYKFIDDYDEKHDAYTGHYKVMATTDIVTKERTIKKGEDLTAFTTQTLTNGTFEIAFNADFLETVSNDSAFGAEVVVSMQRIAPGEVENVYTNVVNGHSVLSNKVKTNTPKPVKAKKVEEPKPKDPEPTQPPKKVLPKTGDSTNHLGVIGTILSMLGISTYFVKRTKDLENEK